MIVSHQAFQQTRFSFFHLNFSFWVEVSVLDWSFDGAFARKVYWGVKGKSSQAFEEPRAGTRVLLGVAAPDCPMLPPLEANNRLLRQVLFLEFDFHYDQVDSCSAGTLPQHCPLAQASHDQHG